MLRVLWIVAEAGGGRGSGKLRHKRSSELGTRELVVDKFEPEVELPRESRIEDRIPHILFKFAPEPRISFIAPLMTCETRQRRNDAMRNGAHF